MRGNALLGVIGELNVLIDTGLYDAISLKDVKVHIVKGDVLEYLSDLAGTDIDLSIHLESAAYGDFPAWYTERMQSMHNAYSGDERRKFGIERRGLCLLLAWTLSLCRSPEIEWNQPGKERS